MLEFVFFCAQDQPILCQQLTLNNLKGVHIFRSKEAQCVWWEASASFLSHFVSCRVLCHWRKSCCSYPRLYPMGRDLPFGLWSDHRLMCHPQRCGSAFGWIRGCVWMRGSGSQRCEVGTAGWSISSHWYRDPLPPDAKERCPLWSRSCLPRRTIIACNTRTDRWNKSWSPNWSSWGKNIIQTAWDAVRTGGNLVVLGKMLVYGHVSLRWGSVMGEK